MGFFIHESAILEDGCTIGEGTKIWHFAHIRKGAVLGEACIVGKSVFIDEGVIIGNSVKIQNNVSIYHGVEIEEGVFIGPHVTFTTERYPRAIYPDGGFRPRICEETKVKKGASIGANSTIVTGITLGEWCMIGAGSVVTRSIPPYALAYGNPAKLKGIVSPLGEVLSKKYLAGTYPTKDKNIRITILEKWVKD